MGQLRFAGKEISIRNLDIAIKSAPLIDVSVLEINPLFTEEVQFVDHTDSTQGECIVYKHEGMYLVLRGVNQACDFYNAQKNFPARLLTKQLLKRIQVMDAPLTEQDLVNQEVGLHEQAQQYFRPQSRSGGSYNTRPPRHNEHDDRPRHHSGQHREFNQRPPNGDRGPQASRGPRTAAPVGAAPRTPTRTR